MELLKTIFSIFRTKGKERQLYIETRAAEIVKEIEKGKDDNDIKRALIDLKTEDRNRRGQNRT